MSSPEIEQGRRSAIDDAAIYQAYQDRAIRRAAANTNGKVVEGKVVTKRD